MDHYFTNNDNLKSNIREINYSYGDIDFSFFVDNGVFSKNKIDYGSRLLLETVLKLEDSGKSILDVGCGYGFLGIVLGKILKASVDMVDVNKRALHLTKRNLDKNHVFGNAYLSNAYSDVEKKYDIIITNPPIKAGKEVLKKILEGARCHLNPSGVMYYVQRKDHGAKSMAEYLKKYYKIEIIEKDKGFYIFKAKPIDSAFE